MGKVKHPKGGKDWAQYTVVVERELLEKFRRMIVESKEPASVILSRHMRSSIREWEKKQSRLESQSDS